MLDIEQIRFCAIECKMQRSGEESVYWMCRGWEYALEKRKTLPKSSDILILGALIEPTVNRSASLGHYRYVPVWVGDNEKLPHEQIPRAIAQLTTLTNNYTPAEYFRAYEEIHPFVDGNGRTGQILFNWLNGSLHDPVWAPNFWDDPRRTPGFGAPD